MLKVVTLEATTLKLRRHSIVGLPSTFEIMIPWMCILHSQDTIQGAIFSLTSSWRFLVRKEELFS
jgi:hypothetical protein